MKNQKILFLCIAIVFVVGFCAGLGVYFFNGDRQVPVDRDIPLTIVPGAFKEELHFTTEAHQAYQLGSLIVELTEINDSRCPEDATCYWAGELSARFSVRYEESLIVTPLALSLREPTKEISLSGENNREGKYTLLLKDISENEVTIVIEEK